MWECDSEDWFPGAATAFPLASEQGDRIGHRIQGVCAVESRLQQDMQSGRPGLQSATVREGSAISSERNKMLA
ncbi:hypothetical protein, partial [Dokdonella sp.]|uniref:hypothetical protein n=1 Tax=Dokdonella sp. TaxID=2291710 RepID=UPI003C7913F6